MADTTFEWINAEGVVTDLNDWKITWAVKGGRNFYNLPFAINSYEVPLTPGEAFSSLRLMAREVDLPVLVVSSSRHEFIEKMRALVNVLNPDKGEGRLRIGHEHNSARELKCRYLRGLEGAADGRGWTPSSAMVIITFRASDPFWYAPASSAMNFILASPVTFFPFFPLKLTQGTIFNTGTVVNQGDHIAWPIWTVEGPGTNLTLRNLTTGYNLEAVLDLAAGESVVIDTRPGIKTVLSGSTNYFSTLTASSVLWGLQRGNNDVQIEFDESDGTSRIRLSYSPPFFSM